MGLLPALLSESEKPVTYETSANRETGVGEEAAQGPGKALSDIHVKDESRAGTVRQQ